MTLFRRFGSKKNLLIAAVEQEAQHFVAAGIEYTGDLEADLLRVVQFSQDYFLLFSSVKIRVSETKQATDGPRLWIRIV